MRTKYHIRTRRKLWEITNENKIKQLVHSIFDARLASAYMQISFHRNKNLKFMCVSCSVFDNKKLEYCFYYFYISHNGIYSFQVSN